ncbi:hypothetical protein Pse7367_1685 [Thalassoporum mexicanum PCC 7367]|uniref:hypothetical protein n=1 Tax=Thalassoporum mexicanum TaxID=3457544 RepID=UPI00029F84F2|nr:hypothetical protein [Pseudanabaena sp. PCC 7367]AFY69973.1 hypothetical protein Pse7367_1685 [Pseudanabaena sp. PCC 7367]
MNQLKQLINHLAIAAIVMFALFSFATPTYASGDLTRQQPVTLNVQLSNTDNELHFYPDKINLETGKLYKLVITNPSDLKHYFSSEKFARAIYTRKVQVDDAAGKKIAEVKGVVREIELLPQGTAEWWFVPVKAGNFDDLKCTVAGHTEAGMVGKVVIN